MITFIIEIVTHISNHSHFISKITSESFLCVPDILSSILVITTIVVPIPAVIIII